MGQKSMVLHSIVLLPCDSRDLLLPASLVNAILFKTRLLTPFEYV